VKNKFNAFKNQMPSQNEIPTLIKRLTAFGKNRNIKMTALTMEEGKIEGFYKEIPFKIQITGKFSDTLDFIEYVQNFLRLVSFENLVLQGRNASTSYRAFTGTEVGSLNTTLTAKTYSFINESESYRSVKKEEPPNLIPLLNEKGH
jgi:type IV pilus assembly protein PilO